MSVWPGSVWGGEPENLSSPVPLLCRASVLGPCLLQMGVIMSLASPAMYPKILIFLGETRILLDPWRGVLGLGCSFTLFIHT